MSTTSCSSDHTVESAGTVRGSDMRLKKRKKDKVGERTVRATALVLEFLFQMFPMNEGTNK